MVVLVQDKVHAYKTFAVQSQENHFGLILQCSQDIVRNLCRCDLITFIVILCGIVKEFVFGNDLGRRQGRDIISYTVYTHRQLTAFDIFFDQGLCIYFKYRFYSTL
ncbi:hypothetical protein D3C86_1467160 [compost metagenome]